ncbi:MAG: phosphoribosylglycinamide formyltransferase [Tagaea sp.]
MARLRTAILISGRGSNMKALIEAARHSSYPAEIVLVASNVPDAAGLDIARAAGIATAAIDHRAFAGREAFERALNSRLVEARVELVCLAGFMRLLTPYFVDACAGRMINIHPSLLPAFPGLDTHKRALDAGARFAGCTVHYVTSEMDVGPIVAQAAVPILPGDDEAALSARVLAAEHRLYPHALALVAAGRARIVGSKVAIDGALVPPGPVFNPPL